MRRFVLCCLCSGLLFFVCAQAEEPLRVVLPYEYQAFDNGVETVNLGQGNSDDELLMMVAGSSEYDLLCVTPDQYAILRSQDALAPIGRETAERLCSETTLRAIAAADGAYYGLPLEMPADLETLALTTDFFVIRDDIWTQISVGMPADLDEFTEFLGAVKLAKGVSPLTLAAGYKAVYILPIMSAFGLGNEEWTMRGGEYVPRIRLPEMTEYLAYLQMLYREGLLDVSFPVNSWESAVSKMAHGKAYALLTDANALEEIRSAISQMEETAGSAGLDYIFRLAGMDGLRAAESLPAVQYVYCIPKSSRNISRTLRWLNGLEQSDILLWPNHKAPEDLLATIEGDPAPDQVRRDTAAYACLDERTYSRIALNRMVAQELFLAVVDDTEPEAAIRDILAKWETSGGLQLENMMQVLLADEP